jgi:pimeloyl-ACP methyl ester carboxylesterase
LENDYVYTFLSWFGAKLTGPRVFERYWETAERKGKDRNPYRLAFVQVAAVAETDQRAEREFGPHLEYFFRRALGAIPPGTGRGDPAAIHRVDDLWDLVLIYEEALAALGLEAPAAVGQSYGGMLAAELASTFPALFSKLVLFDPIGLWREDAPVANWVATPPPELPGLLFRDPGAEGPRAMLTPPADPEAAVRATADTVWAIGCTAKFVWPIPERGLAKRLHRLKAPTLVVWGRQDRLIPVVYAEEFARRIPGCRVEVIEDCGHVPQVEQPERTFSVVSEFLAS